MLCWHRSSTDVEFSVNEKKNRREKLQTNNLQQQQNKFLFLLLYTCFNIILNFSLILSAIFLSNRFFFCCIFIYFDVFVFNAKVMGFWCISFWCITFETRLILFMEWNKSLDFVYTFIPCVVMDVINLFDKILEPVISNNINTNSTNVCSTETLMWFLILYSYVLRC